MMPAATHTTGFCVIFWNVWLENQLSAAAQTRLIARLGTLIDEHRPDAFGLNEILQEHSKQTSEVLDYLKIRGYYTDFTDCHTFKKLGRHYSFGSAIASVRTPLKVEKFSLDTSRKRRKLLVATLPLANSEVAINLAVVHPTALNPRHGGHRHYAQIKALRRIMSKPAISNRLIMGGDLNEFSWMPHFWLDQAHFDHKTGDFHNPTWRWRSSPILPVRANLDHLFWNKDGLIALKSFEVLDRKPSDHSPLLARFTITR